MPNGNAVILCVFDHFCSQIFTTDLAHEISKTLEKIVLGHSISNERFVLFASAPDCFRMVSKLALNNVRLFNGCSGKAGTHQRQLNGRHLKMSTPDLESM